MSEVKQNIQCRVWKIFKRKHNKFRNTQKQIRVVSWLADNKEYGPFLENREVSVDDNGEIRMGKNKGFDTDEVKFLVENSLDIIELMEQKIKPEEVAVGEEDPLIQKLPI